MNSAISILHLLHCTVEHYFQAQKFHDPILQETIRTAATAASAKKLGRTRSPHFRTDWEAVKEEIMLEQLGDLLKSTGTITLKEKAFWDGYWGTGRTGNGKNRMGVLLEQVRSHR